MEIKKKRLRVRFPSRVLKVFLIKQKNLVRVVTCLPTCFTLSLFLINSILPSPESVKEQSDLSQKPPTSNADTGGYADIESKETTTIELPVIELPEIVDIARKIGNGLYPTVKRKLRAMKGMALGYFKLKGVSGEISLSADIFKDPILATKVLAHEIGHWIDALPNMTLSRGNILGRLASLVKYLKTTLASSPNSRRSTDFSG
ncbi:MAG: hypothetical protein QY310_11655 [Candidatus Jettenia sp. CY-1]|nr:MAG: hypothetical protein QY310_11655 [Candidatus Jettenia sp. CY-1]